MSFKDHFSQTAPDYALHRPRYPAALFAFLSSLCARHELAWDCATGNGQAALGLAPHFSRIVASDASTRQIENAVPDPKVSYRVALAQESGLSSGSVDLVTVAQALHWLDLPRFYEEVDRVLVPDGVLAVWCYFRLHVDSRVDAVVRRYHDEIVGPFWPPERELVAKGYAMLAFPFVPVEVPMFTIEEPWDLSGLLGYLETWSATQRCRQATGLDPLEPIRADLLAAWGDPCGVRAVRWPLEVRVGRGGRAKSRL